MNKQRTQLIALAVLVVGWAVYWHFFIKVGPAPTPVAKAPSAKVSQSETLLRSRFHRVRAEIDALYHYRLKPAPFDARSNPFRLPAGMEQAESGQPSVASATKTSSSASETAPLTPDSAQSLLKLAVAHMKIGGVVTLNGITELTVDGQLHREGDVFSTKIQSAKGPARSVIILIRHLSVSSVTLAIGDSEAGGGELRVRLN